MNKFQVLCSCLRCKRETTSGQLSRNHSGDECPKPKVHTRFPKNFGRDAWNKGLTKADPRIKEMSDKQIGKSKVMSEQGKDNIKKGSKNNGGYRENAGRSKKHKVFDSFGNLTTLQSSFELNCSEILAELSINWIRPKALKYNDRNYFADFYLPDFDIWLDPKNDYKAIQDIDKILAVIKQNDIKLFVLSEKQITKSYIGSLIQ